MSFNFDGFVETTTGATSQTKQDNTLLLQQMYANFMTDEFEELKAETKLDQFLTLYVEADAASEKLKRCLSATLKANRYRGVTGRTSNVLTEIKYIIANEIGGHASNWKWEKIRNGDYSSFGQEVCKAVRANNIDEFKRLIHSAAGLWCFIRPENPPGELDIFPLVMYTETAQSIIACVAQNGTSGMFETLAAMPCFYNRPCQQLVHEAALAPPDVYTGDLPFVPPLYYAYLYKNRAIIQAIQEHFKYVAAVGADWLGRGTPFDVLEMMKHTTAVTPESHVGGGGGGGANSRPYSESSVYGGGYELPLLEANSGSNRPTINERKIVEVDAAFVDRCILKSSEASA